MAMPSFAFSVHNFISSTGADAGFAAIIGLAILVLLYFAHARETANLREEAALLTQRLQHAEARVAQLARFQAATDARSEMEVPAVAIAPFAPAGTGAPALASATHVIPVELQIPEPEEPIVVQRPAPAAAPALAMAGVASAAVAPPPAQAAPPPPVPGVPAPATSAGGNGAARSSDGPPPVASRRPAPPRAYPPLELPPRKRRSRLGRGMAVAVVALAAVAVAVVLFAVTAIGGSNTHTSNGQTTNAPGSSHAGGAAAFKPASITVAVLNGTSVNQLAHRVGSKLTGLGYKEGTLATASNQTETKTTVAYLPGRKNRVGAFHVATALGLRRSAVQRVGRGTLQVACPGPSTCTANVVVTVGADLSTL